MSILHASPRLVNPARRVIAAASWPAWTDESRWTLATPDDGPRPTAGPDFAPTPADSAEAVALLNAMASDYWPSTWPDPMEVSTVSDWDFRAEALAGEPFDNHNPDEIIRAHGVAASREGGAW